MTCVNFDSRRQVAFCQHGTFRSYDLALLPSTLQKHEIYFIPTVAVRTHTHTHTTSQVTQTDPLPAFVIAFVVSQGGNRIERS